MVLQNGRFSIAQCSRDALSFAVIQHHTREVIKQHVIIVEGAGILGDRLQRPAERGEGGAVDGVRVAHGHDLGVRLVHRRVQHEARAVHGIATLNHLA